MGWKFQASLGQGTHSEHESYSGHRAEWEAAAAVWEFIAE